MLRFGRVAGRKASQEVPQVAVMRPAQPSDDTLSTDILNRQRGLIEVGIKVGTRHEGTLHLKKADHR